MKTTYLIIVTFIITYVVWLVSYYGCQFLAWLQARFINTYNKYILHITRYTLFVWKKDKALRNCFRDSLKEKWKVTKQRISNKQNFTHLSATCDWNNWTIPTFLSWISSAVTRFTLMLVMALYRLSELA